MMLIREAKLADIEALQALSTTALNAQYEGTNAADENMPSRLIDRIYSIEALRKTLNSDNRHILIAQFDETIVGMCQYGVPIMDDCDCEDLREIQALLVHPDYSMHDIGCALVEAIEASINEDATVQRLSVFVNPNFMSIVKFYAKLGFHHDQAEDVDNEWYMEKNL